MSRGIDLKNDIPALVRCKTISVNVELIRFQKSLLCWHSSLHQINSGQKVLADGKTLCRSEAKRKKLA